MKNILMFLLNYTDIAVLDNVCLCMVGRQSACIRGVVISTLAWIARGQGFDLRQRLNFSNTAMKIYCEKVQAVTT